MRSTNFIFVHLPLSFPLQYKSFFPLFFFVSWLDSYLLSLFSTPSCSYCIYTLHGHSSTIRCIKVLHNRPLAVSGSRDNTVRVWDIQKGQLSKTLEGHTASVRCLDVCGNRVVSGSYDTTCRVSMLPDWFSMYHLKGFMLIITSISAMGRRHRPMHPYFTRAFTPDLFGCV